jgi:hypothetical protein
MVVIRQLTKEVARRLHVAFCLIDRGVLSEITEGFVVQSRGREGASKLRGRILVDVTHDGFALGDEC